MSAMVEGAERRYSPFVRKLMNVAEVLKVVAKYAAVLMAFLGIVCLLSTNSTADKLKHPAYCFSDTNMVGDYLIAGIRSDNTVVAFLPSNPSEYYLVTLSTVNWDTLGVLSKVGAVTCGGKPIEFITIESAELLTISAMPVEVIEVQEVK